MSEPAIIQGACAWCQVTPDGRYAVARQGDGPMYPCCWGQYGPNDALRPASASATGEQGSSG